MSHIKSTHILLLGGIFSLLFSSCFKDVDFGQSEDIKLAPDLEVDLLFYQLNESDFLDSETNAYSPIIRDTVRLEFLDDDYIQEGLVLAEFRFRHENRFPYEVRSNIKFIDKTGRNQFNVEYNIPAGSETSASIVDTLHLMSDGDITKVKRSINMVVELEILNAGKDLQGELDFLSKGFFEFEF